jgi:hypothetical protein
LTGQHIQPLKPSGWLVFGKKLNFLEREAVLLIPSVDALFYLCSVGRKTEGWLLFASITERGDIRWLEAARTTEEQ